LETKKEGKEGKRYRERKENGLRSRLQPMAFLYMH